MAQNGRSRLAIVVVALFFLLAGLPRAAQAESPYVVQPGDSISAIAARFSTTVAAIVAANNLDDPNVIAVGQRLTIPGGAVASETDSTAAAEPAPVRVKLATAPPNGPQSVLGNRRLLTFYGHPNDNRMGILGELSKEELVASLQRWTAKYQALSDRPVQPAIHYIATVAQESAGADGKYRARSSEKQVREYSELARQNGMLLILDLQVGHSTVREELIPWIPLLAEPHVHLALDPEFEMWPGQLPGEYIGHTMAADINHAQDILTQLVVANGLPDKVLILHQFYKNMLPDKQNIQNYPRVQVVTDMDGWGTQSLKLKHYEWYVHDTLVEHAGMKLFFRQDKPLFTPEEIMDLDPVPDVIVYQ